MAELSSAQIDFNAADIYYNIIRGVRIQNYLFTREPFTVPVLWFCNLLIPLLLAALIFPPYQGDIEFKRFFFSSSRYKFWSKRLCHIFLLSAVYVIFRLLLCLLAAFLLGRPLALLAFSDAAFRFFESQGVVIWDVSFFIIHLVLEFFIILMLVTVAAFFTTLFGLAISILLLMSYIFLAVFTCSPLLLPNLTMAHRLAEYITGGFPFVLAALGALGLVVVSILLFKRLLRFDFLS